MQIIPIEIQKEIEPGDDVSDLILGSAEIQDGDILVVAQKIISKQENRLVDISTISPSLLSEGIAGQYNKDPRLVELVLSETKRIIRMGAGVLIVETNHGFICANAGVDESNVRDGYATLLPLNSDISANTLRQKIQTSSGIDVPVIISDTFGRPFRMGQTNCALGISGLNPILDYAGSLDSFKKILRVTAIAIADELSSAAELVMEKTANCPVVIIRDYEYEKEERPIEDLIRPENEDLFR